MQSAPWNRDPGPSMEPPRRGGAPPVRATREQGLSESMGRKRRVDPTSIRQVRNDYGVSKPGDKCYSNPEYAPGFFKEGSGVPGAGWGTFKPLPPFQSKNTVSKKAGPVTLTTTVHGIGKEGPPPGVPPSYRKMTLEQRRKAELLAAEVAEVSGLTPSDDVESWEEKTGNLTVTKTPKEPTGDGE